MQATSIRRATAEDFETIQRLNRELFAHDGAYDPFINFDWPDEAAGRRYYRLLADGEYGVCFIAEVEGKPVGYLAGAISKEQDWRDVRVSELENMHVEEPFRGKGVGRRLAESFVDWSREQGVERVRVSAYAANGSAIGFYKKLGFEPSALQLEMPLES